MTPNESSPVDIARLVENLPPGVCGPVSPVAFCEAYVAEAVEGEFAGTPSARLARILAAHIRLGLRRLPGEDLLAVTTPTQEADGWSAGGSTLVQVVTDDRPFLVDTLTMRLTEAGWTTRGLHHPIVRVERGADGVLTSVAERRAEGSGLPESWISIEAYPPLGRSAETLTDALTADLRDGLAAGRLVHEDAQALRDRLAETVLLLDETAQPISPHAVRGVVSLLEWLGEDHFEFFGYREYTVDGTSFTPVAGSGLGILRGEAADPFSAIAPGEDDDEVLVMTKDSRRSPLHRSGYLDYLAVRTFDRAGRIVGERRFLGLLNSAAYSESLARVPLLSEKVRQITQDAGYDPDSHSGHMVELALASYPRDELFSLPVRDLTSIIPAVAGVQERRQTRLFLRRGRYGRFWSCLVYLPRDRYRTAARERIQDILLDRLGGESLDFRAVVSEGVLARLFFVVKRPDGAGEPEVDPAALERDIVAATRVWDDDFNDVAAGLPADQRGVQFGDAYEAAFTAEQAVADLTLANRLTGPGDLEFALYAPDRPGDSADLRFKVITHDRLTLSTVMPHLDALGVNVTDERPFEWELRGKPVFVYEFGFRLPEGQTLADWAPEDRARFAEAFAASYRGLCETGPVNRLVMRAGLTWVETSWLRAISRYLQQARTPWSQAYIAGALLAHPEIAGALVSAFRTRFDPALDEDVAARQRSFDEQMDEVLSALDAVESLDQDRILRAYVAVLRAIVRTNAFAEDAPALAFKLLPRELPLLPEPRPEYEIYVYSPRVQGVHLRFGPVARGGLRWSDRHEDFRTETLGLAKAQMVKNTVIVPVGAKGGFVPARLPDPRRDRAGWLAEGTACYEIFIGSLLSVTDNLVDGRVVPPPDVVRHDGDDPYLVVAADKGTATFSDVANAIAVRRGFWLGDAFASGGSAGYDHKGMGITARGAWESVKRHFFERGIDCQREDFTCVGIGDMAGDVFGNGMLQSRHTRLVAAFNHQHVFLDPDPDPEASYAERERLFGLPRSSWADYDASAISAGGGVWERTAKAVPIGPAARAALGLDDVVTSLTPNEVVRAILRAPVDLLWNGGVGTFVKASDETQADVDDKVNDALRVDGRDVRAKIAGEGGNLGWTMRGRIEFARLGGRINTDFIDNSAGVDTSDHEVNIKVLLTPEVAAGRLTEPERNELLASMTDDVARHVLAHNVDQNLALSMLQVQAPALAGSHEGWMRRLETAGLLDRTLEGLPSSSEMEHRIASGEGLTRPELCALLAWTKIALAEWVLDSGLPDDPYLADRLVTYFPGPLRERFADELDRHPLRREIITMVAVNRFVNSQGISAYHRLSTETSADVAAIVRAQLAARTIFAVARDEREVNRLTIDAATEVRVLGELQRMIERAARWLLHNRRSGIDIQREAAAFTAGVARVRACLGDVATEHQRVRADASAAALLASGVGEDVARRVSQAWYAHAALPIVELAGTTGRDLDLVTRVWFALAAELGLDRVMDRVTELPQHDRWDTTARAALRDDLQTLHAELAQAALAAAPDATESTQVLAAWRAAIPTVDRMSADLAEVVADEASLARLSVATRLVRTLLV